MRLFSKTEPEKSKHMTLEEIQEQLKTETERAFQEILGRMAQKKYVVTIEGDFYIKDFSFSGDLSYLKNKLLAEGITAIRIRSHIIYPNHFDLCFKLSCVRR